MPEIKTTTREAQYEAARKAIEDAAVNALAELEGRKRLLLEGLALDYEGRAALDGHEGGFLARMQYTFIGTVDGAGQLGEFGDPLAYVEVRFAASGVSCEVNRNPGWHPPLPLKKQPYRVWVLFEPIAAKDGQ